jgi:hypothetical protein
VLFAVLYNLISDVVGGVVVVFEERPGRRAVRTEKKAAGGEDSVQPLKPSRTPRNRSRAVPVPDTTPMPDMPEPQVQAELTRPAD